MAEQLLPIFHYPGAYDVQDTPQAIKVESLVIPYDGAAIKKQEFVQNEQNADKGQSDEVPPYNEQSQRVLNPVIRLKTEEVSDKKMQQVLKPDIRMIKKMEDDPIKASHNNIGPVQEEGPVQQMVEHDSFEKEYTPEDPIEDEISLTKQDTEKIYSVTRRDRHDRQGPNEIILQKLKRALELPTTEAGSPAVAKVYEEQLKEELRREAEKSKVNVKAYVSQEMDLARKNITQKYMRLYRLTMRLLDKSLYDQESLGMLQGVLSRSVTSISTILGIYRQPAFKFFVDFLKKEVVTPERFPYFVVALPVRTADKIVMLGGVPGMVYAINNPHVTLRSWFFNPTQLVEDTSHIAQAVRQHKIDSRQVIKMLEEVYAKVVKVQKQPKSKCLYSNVASRFATIIQQAILETRNLGLLKEKEEREMKQANKRMIKSASIATIKDVLAFETLRSHLKTNFIQSGRLVIQMLGDPSMNCRTKLGIMGSYGNFCKAVDDPKTLKKWQ